MPKKTNKPRAQRSTKASRSLALLNQIEWSEDLSIFQSQVGRELNRLNQEGSVKDFRKYANRLVEHSGLFSKSDTQAFIRAADRMVTQTICSLGALHFENQMPLTEWVQSHIQRFVTHTLDLVGVQPESENKIKTPVQVANRPNIQEIMLERTNETIGELEGEYDLVILNRPSPVKPFDILKARQVSTNQLGRIQSVFQERKVELETAQELATQFKSNKTWSDEVQDDSVLAEQLQIAESYRHYTSKDYKRLLNWLQEMIDAVEQYRRLKSTTKSIRKTSPAILAKRNASKAAKVKYLKTDPTYSLTSVNPITLIGATEVWVFNAKTRKLGKYVAQEYQTLDLSGTSLKNFNPTQSVSKTLRKPAEQLKEFAKAGKVALRSFLKDIRATETKLSGRLNTDTIILKVQ